MITVIFCGFTKPTEVCIFSDTLLQGTKLLLPVLYGVASSAAAACCGAGSLAVLKRSVYEKIPTSVSFAKPQKITVIIHMSFFNPRKVCMRKYTLTYKFELKNTHIGWFCDSENVFIRKTTQEKKNTFQ